ncbi:MAG: hypothetical protein HFE63_05245 [Clostridiales bacterium]|nr:hypothetical protein [Clostridiales bacterium]
MSQKVLTANLRDMEDFGLLMREVFPEVLPRGEKNADWKPEL